jgi:hypothetical protein
MAPCRPPASTTTAARPCPPLPDRNVTIQSLSCVGLRALNFRFLGPRVMLGDGVVLTLERVRLVHARCGAAPPACGAGCGPREGAKGSDPLLSPALWPRHASPTRPFATSGTAPRPPPNHRAMTDLSIDMFLGMGNDSTIIVKDSEYYRTTGE